MTLRVGFSCRAQNQHALNGARNVPYHGVEGHKRSADRRSTDACGGLRAQVTLAHVHEAFSHTLSPAQPSLREPVSRLRQRAIRDGAKKRGECGVDLVGVICKEH